MSSDLSWKLFMRLKKFLNVLLNQHIEVTFNYPKSVVLKVKSYPIWILWLKWWWGRRVLLFFFSLFLGRFVCFTTKYSVNYSLFTPVTKSFLLFFFVWLCCFYHSEYLRSGMTESQKSNATSILLVSDLDCLTESSSLPRLSDPCGFTDLKSTVSLSSLSLSYSL